MRWSVANDKSNFSFIHVKFPFKFTDTIFKNLTIHLTLLLCDILVGQIFKIFKTARAFLFAYNKHGKLSSCNSCCRHSGYSYFAFLSSRALFPFELIVFVRKTFVERAKIISIKYIFEPIVWYYVLQGCFIPRIGPFICNRFGLATNHF